MPSGSRLLGFARTPLSRGSERELADLYEEVARVDPMLVATWFRTRLKKVLNYMGLRAATEEGSYGEVRGCYIAGLFDKFPGEVTELPNIPDWTNIGIKLDGETFSLCRGEILSYQRQLNMRDGEVVRNIEWMSPAGKKTQLVFRRFVSMWDLHIAAIKIVLRYSLAISIILIWMTLSCMNCLGIFLILFNLSDQVKIKIIFLLMKFNGCSPPDYF